MQDLHQFIMCTEYQTTKIVGGVTTTEMITDECSEKPATGTVKDCPKCKFNAAGSSRQTKTLPGWAKGGAAGA
jgi:hypothetical protein